MPSNLLASDVQSVSDVSSHREGEPPFPPSLRGYETSRPLRHVACGHWDGFVGADGGDVARSEDGCVEPSGRKMARMSPRGAIWEFLIGRASISTVGGHYIYKVACVQISTLSILLLKLCPRSPLFQIIVSAFLLLRSSLFFFREPSSSSLSSSLPSHSTLSAPPCFLSSILVHG